jgi:hypothetical protein
LKKNVVNHNEHDGHDERQNLELTTATRRTRRKAKILFCVVPVVFVVVKTFLPLAVPAVSPWLKSSHCTRRLDLKPE